MCTVESTFLWLPWFIPETVKSLEKIISHNKENSQIKVFTPYPLSEALKKDICRSLKDTKDISQIQEYVDEKYIAGFRTEYNFIFNDKTALYKLNKLEEFLKEKTNIA